ncbi:MAG: amidophosphoribosyltransferase [Actinobacteria bacterium]|nr:amidophosphoribosyltransferase [Actinomycetota bacterium]
MREACGIVGIFGRDEDVATQVYFALYAVQHRGQESAGMAVGNGTELRAVRAMGLVSRVFSEQSLAQLKGNLAVGHCRYSTTGSSSERNIQPVLQASDLGLIAVAHNGNIVNAAELRNRFVSNGEASGATTDTAVIALLIARAPGKTLPERVRQAVPALQGSFSLAIASATQLIAVRDGMGNRPLCLGHLGDGWIVASETCALDSIGATYVRDVGAGEIVAIDADGLHSLQIELTQRRAMCAFEYIYFSRPDSVVDGSHIHTVRREMGRLLARQRPVEADLVVGVPDSAIAAATGFAEAAGLPYTDGFVRNRYIGRTFIEPTPRLRQLGARLKYNALPEVTGGQRVVMVDDSIVRGVTQAQLVRLLREQGQAKEVHVRICAPPIRWPCFLGIDIPDPDELIAHKLTPEAICQIIGADSLVYLTVDHLVEAIGHGRDTLCLGCFTRDYPIDVQLAFDKFALERPVNLEMAMVFPREAGVTHPSADASGKPSAPA